FLAADRLDHHPRLELRTVLFSRRRHRPLLVNDSVEILAYCLVGNPGTTILDSDLAELYQVPTKSLNLAVKRSAARFPDDFMFRLTKEEVGLRFQFETSKTRGGRRYLPHAFTEQGVAMLSSVLKSTRAIQVNIAIMRAFVQLRQILATHKGIAEKLQAMECKYDKRFKVVFEILPRLMAPPPDGPKRPIGFVSGGRK
ncbi:MAG: ORF6N domain-containing protein, partial [Bryobacteraceae bacterium]